MKKRGAFTLIELLVVIAIIALLLSIILPALKKTKAQARKVIDMSNLKSLSTAIHIYLNTNDDHFFDYGTGTLWMDRIGYLVDNIDKVRFCPETLPKLQEVEADYKGSPRNIWGESLRPWVWNNSAVPGKPCEMGSYGLNGWLYSKCGLAENSPPDLGHQLFRTKSAVTNPSRTPFLADANWVDGWPQSTNTLPATAVPAPSTAGYRYDWGDRAGGNAGVPTMIGRFVLDRHGPETNVIFLDGQAKLIPHAELWALSWHKGAKLNFNPVVPKPAPVKR